MNKDKGPWLTININPPKLDVKFVARTEDKFGYGATIEIFQFDSEQYDEFEATDYLTDAEFIEWMELPL